MDKKNELMQKLLNYWFVMDKLNQNAHPADEVRKHYKKVKKLEQELNRGKKTSQEETLSKTIIVHTAVRREQLNDISTIIENELAFFDRYCEIFEPGYIYEAGNRISVFLGEVSREDMLAKLSAKLNPSGKDDRPEKMTENISLALVSADHNGFYMRESLSLSPIVWCESVLKSRKDVMGCLTSSKYRDIQKALDEKCTDKPLNEVMDILAKEYDYRYTNSGYEYLLKFKLYKKKKNAKTETPEEEDTERLGMSFYADDLEICMDMLKRGDLPDIVKNYLTAEYGFDKKPEGSADLVNGSAEMLRQQFDAITDIRKMPRGKWPSRFAPALMQQAAIDLEIDRKGTGSIFSVNGPPGTGKTTLLKEIIVNNIVERAALIYKYTEDTKDPDKLFDSHPFTNGNVKTFAKNSQNAYDYGTPYRYSIKQEYDDINDYGIVVTSCNNTAVENISKELPKDDFTKETALADYRKLCDEMKSSPETVEKTYHSFCKAHGALSSKDNKSRFEKDEDYPAAVQLEDRYGIPKEISEEDGFFKIAELLSPVCTENRQTVYFWEKDKNNKSQLTGRETNDVYFSYFATSLLNKDNKKKTQDKLLSADKAAVPKEIPKDLAWGMIAAPLGKSSNIFGFYKEALKPMLELLQKCTKDKALHEECLKQFQEARIAFKKQLDTVDHLRNELSEYAQNVRRSEHDLSKEKNYKALLEEKRGKAESAEKILAGFKNVDEYLANENGLLLMLRQKQQELSQCEPEKERSSFLRLFGKKQVNSENSVKRQALETEINNIKSQLDMIKTVKSAKEGYIRANADYEMLKDEYKAHQAAQKADGWKHSDRAVLNSAFIQDYLDKNNKCCTDANVAELWATKKYDREREKLFYLAMQLNKHTVLASKRIFSNLNTLAMYWGYKEAQIDKNYNKAKFKFNGDEADVAVPSLMQTLLLTVPVISTTFASVGLMFRNVKKPGVIGTLIVDEAGQATPECAVGALLRSRRAMIVGDPKQVEPVVTDDLQLIRDSYDDEMLEMYKSSGISVQVLADHLNKYGTMLKEDENDENSEVWVGCPLVVHRRCISPMFEISNDAYNNNMKNQTAPPKPEDERTFISESCWMDIDGKENGNKDHYVSEQGKKVAELIIKSFEKNSSPDIFVISPFTTVVKGIRKEIKTMLKARTSSVPITDSWLENNIGTVHKFQGKEAKEVFFLLGCDTQAKGAVLWVKKNIVNVAATRAKYRLYVVGHYKDVWENNKELKKAYQEMEAHRLKNLKTE